MFFDCTALLAGLAASVISRWRCNDSFSYGSVLRRLSSVSLWVSPLSPLIWALLLRSDLCPLFVLFQLC